MTYIRAHNHQIGIENTVHQPTPASVFNSVKTKLPLGVPVKNIFRELKEGINDRNSREISSEVISKRDLLKKSNVSNISKHMNYGRRLHPDDSTSINFFVKKLQEDEFNIVLHYKPQGNKVVIGSKICDELDLWKNLFAIGLQTKQQLDMFIKHVNKIVCIEKAFLQKLSFRQLSPCYNYSVSLKSLESTIGSICLGGFEILALDLAFPVLFFTENIKVMQNFLSSATYTSPTSGIASSALKYSLLFFTQVDIILFGTP